MNLLAFIFAVLACSMSGLAAGVAITIKNRTDQAFLARLSNEIVAVENFTRASVGQIRIDLDKLGNEIKGMRDMLKTYETNRK